jgi:hypothetical protein
MSSGMNEQWLDLFVTVLTCFLFLNLFDDGSEGFVVIVFQLLAILRNIDALSQSIHIDLECLQLVVGVHEFALDIASSRCAATDGLRADPVPESD